MVADDRPVSCPDGPDPAGAPLSVSVAPARAPPADGPARFPLPPFSWPDGTGDCEAVPAFIPEPVAVTVEPCEVARLSLFPEPAGCSPANGPDVLPEEPDEPATEASGDRAAWDPAVSVVDPTDVLVEDPVSPAEETSPDDPTPLPPGDPEGDSAADAADPPDWPLWAASAGRHAIQIPSARIRRIQLKRLFILVLYA